MFEHVANELGVNLRHTSGPVLERAGDLAAMLTNLEPRDVLFRAEVCVGLNCHRFSLRVFLPLNSQRIVVGITQVETQRRIMHRLTIAGDVPH